jgi:hypothetical protein
MTIFTNTITNFTVPNFGSYTDMNIKNNFSATFDENTLDSQDLLVKSAVLEFQDLTKKLAEYYKDSDDSEGYMDETNEVFTKENKLCYPKKELSTNISDVQISNTYKEKNNMAFFQTIFQDNYYKEPEKNNVTSSVEAEFVLSRKGTLLEANYIKHEIIRPEGTQIVQFTRKDNLIEYTQIFVPKES